MPLDVSEYPPDFGDLLNNFNAESSSLMSGLESGRLSPDQWRKEFTRLLSVTGQTAHLLGADADGLTDDRKAIVGDWLRDQTNYLENFYSVIQSSPEYNAAWENRARMYGASSYTQYWEGKTGDLPLPAMPGQGTQCKSNCKCSWEIVWINERNGDADCYWRLGNAEHCQTCEVRAEMWNPVRIRGGDLSGPEDLSKISKDDLMNGLTDNTNISGRDFDTLVGERLAKEWNPSKETLETLAREEGLTSSSKDVVVTNLLDNWIGSSGNIPSIEVLRGAIKTSGGKYKLPVNEWMESHPAIQSDLMDLGRIMYEQTQRWFKDRGINYVTLYRSYIKDANQPFTSWSTERGGFITTDPGRITKMRKVPVKRVLSMAGTGFGNIVESEVVVAGVIK